ncbi:MAG: Ig-like domain-containing protein, partial [Thermoplasmata archaeon]|nr:Ig-like domain-containing protein [Thermoplasmata archaeon]
GALISWYGTNETDIDHYSIYMNSTPPLLWEADGWDLVANTSGVEVSIGISGLVDGLEYLFRVSAVGTSGYESTPSVWLNMTPMDSTPPNVDLLTTSYTIVGIAELEFIGDPDLDRVEVEYFNDTDNNGVADDPGEEYRPVAIGPPVGFKWDTRSEAGGPGDVPHMMLRYRGYDEVNNTSNWKEASGFSVDNTGPGSVSIISPPPRITDQEVWVVEGLSEPLGWVVVKVNGEEQTNNTVGGSGRFDIYLRLEEGYNEVLLEAYDKHGAGPTNRTYDITLDTLIPIPVVDVVSSDVEREISPEGSRFNSTSYDVGLDPAFTRVDNTSWKVVDPEGGILFEGFGTSVLIHFDSLGYHWVNLTVRDPAGNQNYTAVRVNVTDTTPPVVNFTGPEVVDEDHSVQYTADGTTDNDLSFDGRPLTSYVWFFEGRGWNSTHHGHTIWINFPHPGTYNATLEVTDGGGNVGSRTRQVMVLDHTPPTGSISGPFAVYLGQPVEYLPNITDNDEHFPEGAYFRWNLSYYSGAEVEWSVSLEGSIFPFNFTQKGYYTLKLMVRDPSGNSMNRSVGIDAYGDLTAPSVVSIYPIPNSTMQYPEDLKVTVTFSEDVDQDTLAGSVWFEDITNLSGLKVEAKIEMVDGKQIWVTSPDLQLGHTYRFVVSRGIADSWGNILTAQESRNYTIRSQFSLIFPDGVSPVGLEANFSVGENIVLRFTNPVRLTSLLNHLRIWAVPTDEGDGGFEVSFEVEAGEDEFTAIIHADLDEGLAYEVHLAYTLRDIYDFKLEKDYQWDFKTYKPYVPQNDTPIIDEDDGGEGEVGLNLDQYVPHLLILVAIVLCLIIIFSAISRARRRRKMNRIWEQAGDAPDRSRRGGQVDEVHPGDGPLSVGGGAVVGSAGALTSPPKYEDLYGSPPPADKEMTDPISPVIGASNEFGIGDEGIRWDDEERSDSSNLLDDDDESDWEE